MFYHCLGFRCGSYNVVLYSRPTSRGSSIPAFIAYILVSRYKANIHLALCLHLKLWIIYPRQASTTNYRAVIYIYKQSIQITVNVRNYYLNGTATRTRSIIVIGAGCWDKKHLVYKRIFFSLKTNRIDGMQSDTGGLYRNRCLDLGSYKFNRS